jgi:L-fucose isomerase-like protein
MTDRTLPSSRHFRILPVLVCRSEQIEEVNLEMRIEELNRNILPGTEILKEVVISDEKELTHLERYIGDTDVVLLYKPKLGLGNFIIEIVKFNCPVILFNKEGGVWTPLDALEYVYPKRNVWVAVNYEDINVRIKILEAKKKINSAKLLVLNAEYSHWQRWLCRISGGLEAIEQRFGIEIDYIQSEDVIKRWQRIEGERARVAAEKWIKGAEKIIEPREEDVEKVARLYLVMKDLLKERDAQGLTMAYGDDPLPVPCFAYATLRDEGIPAACEADINSLITMMILHYLTGQPSFMGNTLVDSEDNVLRISHCVAPIKMAGYDKEPYAYILRDQHWGLPKGVLSGFVRMGLNQEVTICRLDGELKNMFATKGEIIACEDLEDNCRVTVKIKIDDVMKFIHSTSGNHHVVVYGDHREKIKELNKLFGITTVDV